MKKRSEGALVTMPLFYDSTKWSRKGSRIMEDIWATGNFGYNQDISFWQKSVIVRSVVSTFHYTCDTFRSLSVFPQDS